MYIFYEYQVKGVYLLGDKKCEAKLWIHF